MNVKESALKTMTSLAEGEATDHRFTSVFLDVPLRILK